MIRILTILALLLGFAASSQAQVSVRIKLGKRAFLHGEAVPCNVYITNNAGRELVFHGSNQSQWIDFIVNSSRGVPLTPVAQPAFGVVKIPPGKTVARSVDLSKLFSLNELGNYSVYSIVRPPGGGTGGFQSQRHLFNVANAKPYWTKKIGVPGRKDQIREYRLIKFTGGQKIILYIQVADGRTGRIIRTHNLGQYISFRKPTIAVDEKLNMHVLYLVTPQLWGHARVDPQGKFLGRDLYQGSEFGDPILVKLNNGDIHTSGGIPYDPKAEAERKAKARKATDRPAFIYE